MKTRIITSAVALVVLALVLVLFDSVLFNLIVAAVCLLAEWEVYHAFGFGRREWIVFAPLVPYTVLVMVSTMPAAWAVLLPCSLLVALYLCVCLLWRHAELDFARMSGVVCFSGLVILCFYSLVYLKHLLPMEQYGSDAIYFILLILGMAWGGDSAAYFTGRFLGKHKLAPVVSPHKTVEGAIGEVFGSMLLAVVITAIYEQIGGLYSLMFSGVGITWRTYLFIAAMGAIGSGLGILGDLFASVVKRQQGIKDYGKIFPGHGGILDRFDSVMFIAPFVTLAVTLLFYRVAQ